MAKVLYLVSHPIQYQVPFLEMLASDPEIELLILYYDYSRANALDREFGRHVDFGVDLKISCEIVPLKKGFAFVESLYRLVNFRPDLFWIHGWSSGLKILLILAARGLGLKVALRGETGTHISSRGKNFSGIKRYFLLSLFTLIQKFFYVGKLNKDFFIKHGVPAHKLVFSPYAVDSRKFIGLQAQQPLASPSTTINFLFLGKLICKKGIVELCEAFVSIRDPSISLTIVGSGGLENDLFGIVGSDSRVRFTGFQSQDAIRSHLLEADCLIVPSLFEPWGLVVNEAIASQTRCIVSNFVGSGSDLVRPETGKIVDFSDPAFRVLNLREAIIEEARYQRSSGAGTNNEASVFHALADLYSFENIVSGVKKTVGVASSREITLED